MKFSQPLDASHLCDSQVTKRLVQLLVCLVVRPRPDASSSDAAALRVRIGPSEFHV